MRTKRLFYWGLVYGATTLAVAQEPSFAPGEPAAAAPGPTALATPSQRLLLLTNGGLLRGEIVEEAARVVVRTPGGEVRVPRADVAAVVNDLAGAWAHRRAELDPDSWQARLDLAEWSLRHGLVDEAAELVAEAQRLEPRSDKAARLARVIELKRRPPPATLHMSLPPLPGDDEHGSAPLPAAAMEAFVRDVQPLVLNSCATGRCHGGGSQNGLRLLRQVSGRVNTRRATSRNLEALLEQIDREAPASSRLLTTLSPGHGGRAGQAVTPAQLELLAAWVALVADKPRGAGTSPLAAGSARRAGPAARNSGGTLTSATRPGGVSAAESATAGANRLPVGGPSSPEPPEALPEEPVDHPEASLPDPLDPTEFNRATVGVADE